MEQFNFDRETEQLAGETDAKTQIQEKLTEVLSLIRNTPLGNQTLREFQDQFDTAVRESSDSISLQRYVRTPRNFSTDEETAAELDQLLVINKLDEKKVRKVNSYRLMGSVLRLIISVLLILLGFGMIIMPAPPYFEMFTLFYLNQNDGVTIMDVISLIVAFTGIYLLVHTLSKNKK